MADAKARYILQAEDRTKVALKRAETGFKKLSTTISKLAGPLAAIGVGAGLERLITDSFAAADAIGKTADKVGVTTDALQELRFAADRTGVSQEQLTSNLTAFVKRVGEAAENTGPLVSFLKKYDQQLLENIKNTESQEEALDLVAEAIKNASSATERAAIANAAFGRSGIGMVNTLRDGKAGLDDFSQSARDAGLIIEEDLIRKAEELNDKWDTFTSTIGTKLRIAVLEAVSAYDQLLQRLDIGLTGQNRFNKLVQDRLELEKQLADAIERQSTGRRQLASVTGLQRALDEVNAEIEQLSSRKVLDIQAEFRESQDVPAPAVVDQQRSQNVAAQRLQSSFQSALEALERTNATLGQTTQFERTLWEVQNGRYRSLTENQQQALLNAARAVDDRQEQIESEIQAARTSEELTRAQDEYNQSQEEAAQRWRELINPMEEVDQQLVELDRLLEEGRISWETYGDAIFRVTDSIGDTADKVQETTDDMSQFAIQAARNMESAFADFLFDPFEDGLDGLGKSFLDTIRRMAAEAASAQIFEKLFGGTGSGSGGELTGLIGTFLAGFFHKGGIVGKDGDMRSVPALAFAGAPRMHTGGIAGLKPNEVPAILERGERVIPKGTQTAVSPNVVVNINTQDVNSFRRSEQQISTQIGNAVNRAIRRNT